MPERGGLITDSRKSAPAALFDSFKVAFPCSFESTNAAYVTSAKAERLRRDRASGSVDHVDGGISDDRVRCACLLVSGAMFGRTKRSNPGSIASIDALCSTCTNACQVERPGLVSFPVRSTSVATCCVLEFLKR